MTKKIRVYRQERMKDKGKANALGSEAVSPNERCILIPILLSSCWILHKKPRTRHMDVQEVLSEQGKYSDTVNDLCDIIKGQDTVL